MTDNTTPLNSANPDPVDQFLGQILDEQQLIIDTPEVRQQIIADMRALLMDQIDQAMVNELNDEQLDSLDQLLDRPDLQDSQIQEFFRQCGINGERVAMETMLRFRQYYLAAIKQMQKWVGRN